METIIRKALRKPTAADTIFLIKGNNDLKSIADRFDIPFYHVSVTKENKKEAEQKQLELLQEHQVDFIVLARYMQIISPKLIEESKTCVLL